MDAPPGGLVIELVAKNGVPQTIEGDVVIERLVLGVTMLRAIGDAAPGDVRTTRTDDKLPAFEWKDSQNPVPHLFPDAPPGMYSTVELRVADSIHADVAVSVSGRVPRGGNVVPFEVTSIVANVPISVAVTTLLPPRGIETTTIEVDVADLVEDIDWGQVPLSGEGRLFIGDGDAQMSKMTSQIAGAFREYKRM